MCFCIPLAFLFAGTIFVFVILGADVCRGGTNVGYQILSAQPNIESNCDSLLGAPLSANNPMACNVSISGDDYVDVNIPEIFSDFAGTCTSCTLLVDALCEQLGKVLTAAAHTISRCCLERHAVRRVGEVCGAAREGGQQDSERHGFR